MRITRISSSLHCVEILEIRSNIIERVLYYWSRIYAKQLKAGNYYDKLEKTIVILIADFNIKGLEELGYHSVWKIMETDNAKKLILTDKFEVDIIELRKIEGKEKEIQIAKNMLKKGMNVSDIIEITGLTKEEIEKLI